MNPLSFREKRGNVAFKCTFNDKNFREVCSQETYQLNVKKGRVWCKDEGNKCRNHVGKKMGDYFPCYECALFVNWQFSPGVKRTGMNHNKPFVMKKVLIDKLAILTSRHPLELEENRYIFGFLHIDNIVNDFNDPTISDAAQFVIGDIGKSLEINPKIRLKFWDFYKNENTDRKLWGSLLYRYMSDESILKFLIELKKKYEEIAPEKTDDIKIIDYHVDKYKLE